MDKYLWIENYCLAKPGVYKVFKEEWGCDLYMIDNKYFIMCGHDKVGREIITLKQNPETNRLLQEKYPESIVPGYYCNKVHWSSVYFDQNPRDTLLKEMIDEAYLVLFNNFSKKRQIEISEGVI